MARHAPGHGDSTAQVDAATAEVLAAFEAAGVDALLLKGPALTALLYAAGEHRSYNDTDLLVAPGQVDAAEKVLAALGYANAHSVTGVDDVGGVVHAHPWIRTSSADESMVDLHRWLAGAERSPTAAWDALVARRTWIDVGGGRAAVLDRPGQAMHLAMHAAQHGPAYERQLGELALALERWPADVWDAAAELAGEIGATPAFAAGLRLLPRGAAEARRLGLASTAELDWKIRHRASATARNVSRAGARRGRRLARATAHRAPCVAAQPSVDHARASVGATGRAVAHRRLCRASGASARLGRPRVAFQTRGQARRPGPLTPPVRGRSRRVGAAGRHRVRPQQSTVWDDSMQQWRPRVRCSS